MQELAFEIPIGRQNDGELPSDLLERARISYVLKFDSDGYLFICKMSAEDWEDYRMAKNKRRRTIGSGSQSAHRKFSVKVLGRKAAELSLQVSGGWFDKNDLRNPRSLRSLEFYRSVENSRMYALAPPSISEGAIRFRVAAEPPEISKLLNGLQELNVPYKVNRRSPLSARGQSLVSELTLQQSRILRCAHTMGYYEIPRRTNTEGLAKVLGMDKATVGEHLRRAEKHVFDGLLE
jgi:DNA-binding MarR family transcriptional regulator